MRAVPSVLYAFAQILAINDAREMQAYSLFVRKCLQNVIHRFFLGGGRRSYNDIVRITITLTVTGGLLSQANSTQPPTLYAGRQMSTGQSAVMLCGWGVKAGMVHSTCG